MTGYDIVLQALGTAGNPIVLLTAVLLAARLSPAALVRAGTAVPAGMLGLVQGIVDGGWASVAYPAVSALAGLLVAEVVLHIVPPLLLLGLRLAAAAQSWLRRRP